jgi:hypothetical protein
VIFAAALDGDGESELDGSQHWQRPTAIPASVIAPALSANASPAIAQQTAVNAGAAAEEPGTEARPVPTYPSESTPLSAIPPPIPRRSLVRLGSFSSPRGWPLPMPRRRWLTSGRSATFRWQRTSTLTATVDRTGGAAVLAAGDEPQVWAREGFGTEGAAPRLPRARSPTRHPGRSPVGLAEPRTALANRDPPVPEATATDAWIKQPHQSLIRPGLLDRPDHFPAFAKQFPALPVSRETQPVVIGAEIGPPTGPIKGWPLQASPA